MIVYDIVAQLALFMLLCICFFFFFQAEDGIRDLVRSRGLGDVYKRQSSNFRGAGRGQVHLPVLFCAITAGCRTESELRPERLVTKACLLYTSDAADERSSVDLGGRRIIKKKKRQRHR